MNQSRRSAFHAGKSRTSGRRFILAHAFEHAVELGLFGEPFGVELGHDRERLVEEVEAAVGVELGDAGGHAVGQLALRFDVAGKLDARVLEVLDVDREAGHRARRQRHVDQAQHAPLARRSSPAGCANRACRVSSARCAPARALVARRATSTSSLPRAMTSAASRASTAATKALN